MIIADDVTNEVNDYDQLAGLAIQARENLGAAELTVVADQGYYNNAEARACVERQITRESDEHVMEARALRTIRMRTERPGKENEERRRRKRSFREKEKPSHASPALDNPHRRCSAWLGRVIDSNLCVMLTVIEQRVDVSPRKGKPAATAAE